MKQINRKLKPLICQQIVRFTNSRPNASRLLMALAALLCLPLTAFAQTSAAPSRSTPAQVVDGRATLVQAYDPVKMLRITIGLTPPHLDQERQLIDQLHDKTSPEFHKWLAPADWDARFAPSAEDEQSVVDWANSQGLTVTNRFPDRLLVDIVAPVGAIEKAFNIKINTYSMHGDTYFANDHDPEIPAGLTHTIHSVMGLNSFLQLRTGLSNGQKEAQRPDFIPGPAVATDVEHKAGGSREKLAIAMKASRAKKAKGLSPDVTNGYYDPTDIYSTQAYDADALNAQGHCCNPYNNPQNTPPETTIAIAAFADLNYSDVDAFHTQYPYLAYDIQKEYIDGQTTCTTFSAPCEEVALDTEWSLAIGNSFSADPSKTPKVWIYEGAGYGDIADVYNWMVTDNNARVSSTSWFCVEYDCFDGPTMDSLDGIFSKMVGQGWTLLAAAGDQGTTNNCSNSTNVNFPPSDPNFIATGGTTLLLYTGPYYDSEVAWTGGSGAGSCKGNNGGTGGGFSAHFSPPSYQSSFGYGNRAIPDMALNASTGQNIYYAAGGGLVGVGGTSIVAPEMAGFFAQQNAYSLAIGNVCGSGSSACAPIGNANYYMYSEGTGHGAPHYPFYDITSGCNTNDITAAYGLNYYCAGTGFDQTTGWGSVNMLQLAWTINWYTVYANGGPSVSFSGPATNSSATNIWYNTDQTVSWTINDNVGDRGGSPTGIAGFTQGWDSIVSDPGSEATPGASNSFYDGPDFKNATTGCLQTGTDNGCAGNVSQGCHTAYVQAWNNMGVASGIQAYGPICYDTVAPSVGITVNSTASGSLITFSAYDATSGVEAVYYQIDGGTYYYYSSPFTISGLGTHTITYYAMDLATNRSAVASRSVSNQANTTTTLAVSANPITYGNSVTLVATVNASSGGYPTGTVTFYGGGVNLGAATLANGKAAITTSAIPVGSVNLGAVYNGSSQDFASTSAAKLETVAKAGSLVALAASENPSPYDAAVTLTATVKSATTGTPTGTVTFRDGSTNLGSAAVTGGRATLSTTALAVGVHSLTALYGGSADFSASTSAVLSHSVSKASTTAAITSSANPSSYEEKVIITVTVKSSYGVPTGAVTLKTGTTTVGTSNLSSGRATFAITSTGLGNVGYTAIYSGNTDFATTTSPTLIQVEDKASTSTSMVSSLNPSTYGKAVVFTATVKPGVTGTPTGTITFKDGSVALGTVNLASGKAAYSTTTLTAGAHAITSVYNGSTDFAGSSSPTLTETVTKEATSTSIVSSLNPSTYGKAVVFSATVRPSVTGTPTGSVTFKNGSVVLGTANLAAGKAAYSTTALTVGTHAITAIYNGSTEFAESSSPNLTETVNKEATSTSIVSSLNPATYGKAVVFTSTVKPGVTGTPVGTVTFKNGSVVLGTVNLANGKASYSTTSLTVGTHAIVAVYNGSPELAGSSSPAVTEIVSKEATSTSIVSSLNPSTYGKAVVFTATVKLSVTGTPTGTVTFKNGSVVLSTVNLTAGKAQYSTTALTVGNHAIVAVYNGSTALAQSTSPTLTETIQNKTSSSNSLSSLNATGRGNPGVLTSIVAVHALLA